MQTKLKDGSVMVSGGCSCDAELQFVGTDHKRLCKVGVAVGKQPNPDGGNAKTIWCNVVAWHNLASVLATACKGDAVFVIGYPKTRTYNDKEYTDLVAEFVSVASVPDLQDNHFAPPGSDFAVLEEDDSELPF